MSNLRPRTAPMTTDVPLGAVLDLTNEDLCTVLENSLIMERDHYRLQKLSSKAPSTPKRKRKILKLNDFLKYKVDEVQYQPFLEQPKMVRGQLKPYQMEGVRWLCNIHERGLNAILADEMGLGKTFQTIALTAYLKETKGITAPHIVLAPKSTLGNWVNEYIKFAPTMKVIGFQGDKEVRHEIKHTLADYDVIVVSYEICIKEIDFLKRMPFHLMVIDEAHRIKNDASKLSMVTRALDTQYRLLLTGTPLQNNLKELWSLLNFLFPLIFHSADDFESTFDLSGGSDMDDLSPDQLDEKNCGIVGKLQSVLRPFLLRRSKGDVMKELPPKKEMLLYVPMSEMQKQLYRNLLTKNLDVINDGGQRVSKLLNICMELRKVCNHPYLFPEVEDPNAETYGEHLVNNAGKMVFVDRLCQRLISRGSRVLIFSQMTRVLDILEDWCRMRGHQRCRIDGTTKDRDEQITRFMTDDNIPLFLLSTRAGGLGINLTKADVVILFDSDWNPQQDLQAMDRAHRIGQTRPVSVYRLIHAHTIEEKIIERANLKLQLDKAIIKKGGRAGAHMPTNSELISAMRFGAAEILKSENSVEQLTDESFETILENASKSAEDLQNKLASKVQKSLLDFSKINDTSKMENLTEMFEDNVDDDNADARALRVLESEARQKKEEQPEEPPAKRRRIAPQNPMRGSSTITNPIEAVPKNPNNVIGTDLLTPGISSEYVDMIPDHQFYEREMIRKLILQANQVLEDGQSEDNERYEVLRNSLEQAIRRGFHDWSRSDFNRFIRGCETFGRDDLDAITNEFEGSKSRSQVEAYSQTFWARHEEILESKKLIHKIMTGEDALRKKAGWAKVAKWKLDDCKVADPVTSETYVDLSKMWVNSWSQSSVRKLFSEVEDKWIIYMIATFGYGDWERLRLHSRHAVETKADWHMMSRTTYELGRRAEMLVRHVKKEMPHGLDCLINNEESVSVSGESTPATRTRKRQRRTMRGHVD